MRNILRATDPNSQTWPATLGQATTLGFDTLLLPSSDVSSALIEAARGLNVALFHDVQLDLAPTADLERHPGPFTRVIAPLTDPRQRPASALMAPAAIATADEAEALASWWAPRLEASHAAGIEGVRLLGLNNLPGWAIPTVLSALREACPAMTLFGWTCGLSWPVLETIPAHSLNMVASSLPWWTVSQIGFGVSLRCFAVSLRSSLMGERTHVARLSPHFAEDWLATPTAGMPKPSSKLV